MIIIFQYELGSGKKEMDNLSMMEMVAGMTLGATITMSR